MLHPETAKILVLLFLFFFSSLLYLSEPVNDGPSFFKPILPEYEVYELPTCWQLAGVEEMLSSQDFG